MQLEIAVQDVPGAELAAKYGVNRIELCCALQVGGLTPSAGLIVSVRNKVPEMPVHALVRPRPGDYVYDPATVRLMVEEIKALRDGGAFGVVIGALTADGRIDYAAVETMVKAAERMHVTFHRAIDHLRFSEVLAAVPRLADLGVGRILSSGGATRAGDGVAQLNAMQVLAPANLEIMAGGGVDIADFATFKDAGLRNVHLSAKRNVGDLQAQTFTAVASAQDLSYYATDEDLVALAASAVQLLL
ncbi:copper homeostasis protein CutC [Arthrobacter cryoconiti]|uniref:PF03932 family protein CutC n=1 Tax=Arthrobacter cryoconiti TaxID=748907 RepID=A0ABV8QX25_9MICC|nr:copper homeostasis protein CutC [Arthrobacter cryoconiti]MCC9069526.1 copper homeostasis protein CutC [Arthrobacter cryoconiti]